MSVQSLILRLEGAIVASISMIAYSRLHHNNWWPFILLILAPDICMLGYIKDVKVGSICYNVGHTYITPAILAAVLIITSNLANLWIVSIWTAHIGLDRAIGYGLKYPTKFQDTHLQRV